MSFGDRFLLTDRMYGIMDDIYGPLLFPEDRSPEQRGTLKERLRNDPELADGWARWRQVRSMLRQRLQERISDRRLLVLYALDQEGRDDAFTTEEKAALDAARDDIAAAIDAIPGLDQVVERIQNERADFEAVWAQHQDPGAVDAVAEERPHQAEREERPPQRPASSREETDRRWAWRLTVAALRLGAAVLAVFFGPEDASRTTVTAEANEREVVEFEDGSTVRLVGAATLSYNPETTGADTRRVTLARGQAFFDIRSRDDASFVVNTPAARAEVPGTQFGVTTGDDTTEIVLVEGTVRVEAEDQDEEASVVLEPGQRSRVQPGQAPSPPVSTDLTAALDWTGLFVFRSTPTRALAQRLSEHYDASITVAPALADEPITGTFDRERSVSEVLQTVARTLGAEVTMENGAYRLAPAS
jgi:ferric-dicitrate binding protein FerR (iron transport regulator)